MESFGKRENEPAKAELFVQGGTVLEKERLTDAAHWVASEEAGTDITIVHQLGTHDHTYDVADVDAADGKHCVPTELVVRPKDESLDPDDQHSQAEVFTAPFRSYIRTLIGTWTHLGC